MNSNLSVTDDRGRSMLRLFSGTRAPSSVPGFPARARAAARAHSRLAAALRRHAHGGRRSPKLPSVPSLIPSSFATRAIGRDVSITIFTASSLNSGEKLFFGRDNYFTFPDVHPIGWTVRKLRGTPITDSWWHPLACGRASVHLSAWRRPDVGGGGGNRLEAEPLQDRPAGRQRVDLKVAVAAGGGQARPVRDQGAEDPPAAPGRNGSPAPHPGEIGSWDELHSGCADRLVAGHGDDHLDQLRCFPELGCQPLAELRRRVFW